MKPLEHQLVTSFKAEDGDTVNILNVNGIRVVETINKEKHQDVLQDIDLKPRVIVHKIDKATRVKRIEALLSEHKTRTEIKDIMYSESMYKNNPNPASAFAGDWSSIQN